MSTGDKAASEVLGELQGKGDYFTKLSVVERKRMADLEDAISYIERETEKFRSKAKLTAIDVMNLHVLTPNPAYSRADGVSVNKQAAAVTRKALNILEATLNKNLQRKSEVINNNKLFKGEIDHYRRLRLQTDITHAKFEQLLSDVKSNIEGLLAEASAVVEERERLVIQKEQLEQINKEEQVIFQAEFEELGLYIKQQNSALEEALLKERKDDKNDKVKLKTKENDDPDLAYLTTQLTLDEEVEMARQAGVLTSALATETSSLNSIQNTIQSYQQMFEQLKKMTGTSSMEEIVSTYVAVEEEMFSLYNFIQTVNAEIDNVVEQQNQIVIDIEVYKQQQQEQEQQRKGVLDELNERIESALEMKRVAEEQHALLQDGVAQISKKVQSIFFKLQCDQMESKGAQQGGGGKKGVTVSRPESKVALLIGQGISESNVLDYMGCIEQRAVDVIAEYLRLNRASTPTLPRSPTPGPPSPMHWPTEAVIGGVDIGEFSEDDLFEGTVDLDGDKPVDLSAFKEKLQKRLGGGIGNSSLPFGRSSSDKPFRK
jgi:hypothetical protein